MIERFDAFISYKHAPLDNRVAAEVQRSLEHFRVPARIQKATGKKKIERIFRDKAELPITSNLSDDISYALEHSNFLIVICSHSTKLSTWVPREIEYFLQFHSISHVLTVLAEGEPSEVIPDILQRDLEPLSCDYRMSFPKARRIELPRLLAALLGCSYDELVMRARQYRMRRLAIIGTIAGILAAGFIAYLLWSRAQIQKNYEISQENLRQARINQSIYLSNASAKLLTEGHDSIGAAQLALAALPSEEDNRPLVSEAICALADAIYAYQPRFPQFSSMVPNGKYTMGSPVKQIDVSQDYSILFALDETCTIAAFDIETQEKLFSLSFEEAFVERCSMMILPDDSILLCDGFKLHRYDWKNDKEIWTYDLWPDSRGETIMPIPDARDASSATRIEDGRDPCPPVAIAFCKSRNLLAVDGADDSVRLIDAATGQEQETLDIGLDDNSLNINAVQFLRFSDNGRYLAGIYLRTESYFPITVFCYDLEREAWHLFETEEIGWEALRFSGDSRLALLSTGGLWNASYANYAVGTTTKVYQDNEALVSCFDLGSDSLLWKTPLPWHLPWERPGLLRDGQMELDGQMIDVFACAVSHSGYILKADTGELMGSNEFSSSVRGSGGIFDRYLSFFLTNGCLGWVYPYGSEDTSKEYPILNDSGFPLELSDVAACPYEGRTSYLCVPDGSCDVLHFSEYYDHDQIDIVSYSDMRKNLASINVTSTSLVLAYEDLSFLVYDMQSGEKTGSFKIEDRTLLQDFRIADQSFDPDTFHLLVQDANQNTYYCAVSFPEGKITEYPIDGHPTLYKNGLLYEIVPGRDGTFGSLIQYAPAAGTKTEIKLLGPDGYQIDEDTSFTFSPDGLKAAVAIGNDALFYTDLQSGVVYTVNSDMRFSNFSGWSEDSLLYIHGTNSNITVSDLAGEIVCSIPTHGRQMMYAVIHEGQLYVAYNSGHLFRYNLTDGSEDAACQIRIDPASYEDSVSFFFSDSMLHLKVDTYMNAIDLAELTLVSSVEECYGYAPAVPAYFVVYYANDAELHMISFREYTVEELIEKGKAFIGENEMPTEMKAEYGL